MHSPTDLLQRGQVATDRLLPPKPKCIRGKRMTDRDLVQVGDRAHQCRQVVEVQIMTRVNA